MLVYKNKRDWTNVSVPELTANLSYNRWLSYNFFILLRCVSHTQINIYSSFSSFSLYVTFLSLLLMKFHLFSKWDGLSTHHKHCDLQSPRLTYLHSEEHHRRPSSDLYTDHLCTRKLRSSDTLLVRYPL